jgi:L-2,4-diaminobutyric acid acetyltransferase
MTHTATLRKKKPEQKASNFGSKKNIKDFNFRVPVTEDAQLIYALAQPFKPYIGNNPLYNNLLVTAHFRQSSVVVEDKKTKEIVGFISGYIVPDRDEKTLFFWEIGVKEGFHGNNLYLRMAHHLINRITPQFIEATVNPSNRSSVRRLSIISKDIRSEISSSVLFEKKCFGTTNHEEELLYRIGPIRAHN